MWWIVAAVVVIVPLALYAGILLAKLQQQQQKVAQARQQRIDKILESVTYIARVVEEEQMNSAEGAIRLVIMLEAMPTTTVIDWRSRYPALYQLYDVVKDMPTHEARAQQKRSETREQDKIREAAQQQHWDALREEVGAIKQLTAAQLQA